MSPEFRAVVEELRRHVDESAIQTRRHVDVLGETLGPIRVSWQSA